MQKINSYLDKFGFPKVPLTNYNISILKEKKIFLLSKFIKKIDLCFSLPSFEIIKGYYGDKYLDKFYSDIVRSFKFYGNLRININLKLIAYISLIFFKKKKIKLNKDEIVLLGPFSNNYYHVIYEFLLRLTYLKKNNFRNIIWVPDSLKPYLNNKIFKSIFKNLKLKYYNTSNNIIFEDINYLTHMNSRWFIKNGKKKISNEYYTLSKTFRKYIFQEKSHEKKDTHKFIIVSRSKAATRNLINEMQLYKRLKKYKFKIINFESFSYEKQIEIAKNCKIMIGYHGSGFANIIFMKSNTRVLEIINRNYDHPLYKLSSKIFKLRYKSFICKKSFKNLDGICDVNQIEKYIQKII